MSSEEDTPLQFKPINHIRKRYNHPLSNIHNIHPNSTPFFINKIHPLSFKETKNNRINKKNSKFSLRSHSTESGENHNRDKA